MKIGITGLKDFDSSSIEIAKRLSGLAKTKVTVVSLGLDSLKDTAALKALAFKHDINIVVDYSDIEKNGEPIKSREEEFLESMRAKTLEMLKANSTLERKQDIKMEETTPSEYFGNPKKKGRQRGKNRRK